jgi:hypothetical protein
VSGDRRRWTEGVLVLLVALAATLPWIHKAYHIDDVLYLTVADQILRTPWAPYGDPSKSYVLWDAADGQPASLFETDYNPPLWKYVLAAGIRFWGREEWKLHLLTSAVVWLAAWALYLVSRRWTNRPVWCVAMILIGPFFLPGQNVMIEPVLLCLAAWSLYFLIRAWDEDRPRFAVLGGVALGLAILAKYTAGVLAGLFVAASILFRRPKSLAFLLPAAALPAVWMLHNEIVYGRQHLTSHGVVFQPTEWPVRVLTVLRIVGAASFFLPIPVSRLWRRGVAGRTALLASAIVALCLGCLDFAQAHATFREWGGAARWGVAAQFVAFTTLGAWVVLCMAAESALERLEDPRAWSARRVDRFLEIWMAGMFAFNVCCVPFNAVRHLLLFFTAMTWRAARMAPLDARLSPSLCLVVSACLGFLLAVADYEFANKHRDFVRSSLARDVQTHRQVWYTGNWGWVYYALEQGASPYLEAPQLWGLGRVQPGDRLYHPEFVNWRALHAYSNRLLEDEPRRIPSIFPVRTIVAGAHYYGVVSHALPWRVPIYLFEAPDGDLRCDVIPLDVVRVFDVLPPAPPP